MTHESSFMFKKSKDYVTYQTNEHTNEDDDFTRFWLQHDSMIEQNCLFQCAKKLQRTRFIYI